MKKCPYDNPDCFNCPFDECVASNRDISRQTAAKKKYIEERNKEIIFAFKNGATREGLADRYGITVGAITRILNENGIRKKRKLKNNENETD